ncbi:MAG: LON peptidase substrate-binding domain-containing protein, partial [Selenomonadaceae bacterium]|nr:LON peptidase substrate-binding domain-containing protein [Selenomonadaceae bacterium]
MLETLKAPLVPLRGVTVFPNMIMHLDVARETSLNALDVAMIAERKIFLVAQKDTDANNPSREDLYTVGTLSEIRQIVKMPDGSVRILVEGINRAVMTDYNEVENYVEVTVDVYEDAWEDSLQLEALVKGVVHAFEEWVKLSKRIPSETFISVTILEDIGRMADLITSHLNLKLESRQELLEALDVQQRLEKLYEILVHEMEVLEMELQINKRVRGQIEKIQKDTYLREQLRAIHKELGEDEDVSETSAEYRKKLNDGDYPDEVRAIIEKELTRMERLPAMAQESSVIRTYIEWLFDLPWRISTKDSDDIVKSAKILDADHYGLEKVKERILDFLAVKVLTKDKPAPILCLIGPPGVGKTSLASSVAKAMDRKFIRASLGGIRDEAEIRGHRRTYVGAMPGRIIQGIKRAGANNPVFLLDEVDKLGRDGYSGDPSSALLEVLDPEQNSTFTDHYIDTAFDLSHVLWIVTANNISTIPKPLRDRMEVITLSSYTEQEKLEIAR